MLCVCPEYSAARQDFLAERSTLNTYADMMAALSCNYTADAERLGALLIRMRQERRKLKSVLERLNEQIVTRAFAARRAAWKLRKKPSCRHGVLFTSLPTNGCKCMSLSSSSAADWEHEQFMPALDHELKAIVAVPFQQHSFVKLGTLQRTARGLGW